MAFLLCRKREKVYAMAMLSRLSDRLSAACHQRAIALEATSFAIVGVVNTAIDLGVFWIAVQKFSVPIVPANVIAWIVAVSASYAMNSFITFARESGRKLTWRAYLTFSASGIAGLIANTATLVVAVKFMPLVVANPDFQLAVSKICAIAVSFLVNFTLSHFVVFRQRG
jgi:putative flippase GtrA